MKKGDVLNPGDPCTVNNGQDLMMCGEAKRFIGKRCTFVKICKSGLYEVALESNPKRKLSVPKGNITVIGD